MLCNQPPWRTTCLGSVIFVPQKDSHDHNPKPAFDKENGELPRDRKERRGRGVGRYVEIIVRVLDPLWIKAEARGRKEWGTVSSYFLVGPLSW